MKLEVNLNAISQIREFAQFRTFDFVLKLIEEIEPSKISEISYIEINQNYCEIKLVSRDNNCLQLSLLFSNNALWFNVGSEGTSIIENEGINSDNISIFEEEVFKWFKNDIIADYYLNQVNYKYVNGKKTHNLHFVINTLFKSKIKSITFNSWVKR